MLLARDTITQMYIQHSVIPGMCYVGPQNDCAPRLGSILCRYDTCPTQYAPDLRGSILCMHGTQYAPRESILCMEHFVALQCYLIRACPFCIGLSIN